MDNEQEIKKQYLIQMLSSISGYDIGQEEYESILWFEQRGYTIDEAKHEVLNKYRKVLLRDNKIVETIVRFDSAYIRLKVNTNGDIIADESTDKDEKYYEDYINHISTWLCGCDFTIADNDLIDDSQEVVKEIREVYIAHEIIRSLVQEREYREFQLRQYENLVNSPKTKAETLGRNITPYGFLALPKTKNLSETSKIKLIELIANNGVPYAIAMFDYLGFVKHLIANHLKTQSLACKEMSKWLGSDSTGRFVKGNLLTLNEVTKENKGRYTAYKHIESVAIDYEKLK